MDDSRAPRADALALAIYRSLQQGDAVAAVARAPEALEAAAGRPRLEARLHAWMSQAHLQLRAPKEARASLRAALRAARSTGDDAEINALRPLQEQILAAANAAAAPAPATPDTPAARAVAAFDAGEPDFGAQLARAAIAAARESGDPREEVISLLALARHPDHTEAAIREAADVADRANDFNLVTAVAHAARSAGVVFEAKVF